MSLENAPLDPPLAEAEPAVDDAAALASLYQGPAAQEVLAREVHVHEPHVPTSGELFANRSFWGMTVTQFLGAFNDNVFKQMLLLMAIQVPAAGAAAAAAENEAGRDLQGIAMFLFALPFVLFSGIAGFISERHGKQTVIFWSKVAEIAVMAMGLIGFWLGRESGLYYLFGVLFFMGMQSAFFGPGKYGILPQLFHPRHLALANGIILMTTFLAIIFGTALAGVLKAWLGDAQLWRAQWVCIGIAIAGTATSLLVRRVPATNPHLQFELSALWVPADIRQLLARDLELLKALFVSCMFWFIGGLVLPAANVLGKLQLLYGDDETSYLAAAVGCGIAVGCIVAGIISRGGLNFRIVYVAAWGLVVCLGLLAANFGSDPALREMVEGERPHTLWRSYFIYYVILLMITGGFAGMFAVPITAFLQVRPPEDKKGRIIATMNLANFLAIAFSAITYAAFDFLRRTFGWPPSSFFALAALCMLPMAIWYKHKATPAPE